MEDTTRLEEIAAVIIRKLPKDSDLEIDPKQKIKAKSLGKDGCFIALGRVPGTSIEAQLWIESDTGKNKKEGFWYGYCGESRLPVQVIAYKRGDSIEWTPRSSTNTPLIKDYEIPKLDAWARERGFFYGVYLSTVPESEGKQISAISNFLADVSNDIKAMDENDLIGEAAAEVEADLVGATEGEERKRVVEHARWERNSKAAQEAKEKAEYCCGVCQEVMSDKYGDIGATYAEAHHKIPLSELEGRKNKITANDLVCVCANCHRMVHRLIADKKNKLDGPAALDELIKRVWG